MAYESSVSLVSSDLDLEQLRFVYRVSRQWFVSYLLKKAQSSRSFLLYCVRQGMLINNIAMPEGVIAWLPHNKIVIHFHSLWDL